MFPFTEVSLGATVAGTVAALILGAIWYGPLFGKKWMKLVGLTDADTKNGAAKAMIMGLFASFISVYIIGLLIVMLRPATLMEGFTTLGLIWLGFIGYNEANTSIWAKSPWSLAIINLGYSLAYVIITSAIFMNWPV